MSSRLRLWLAAAWLSCAQFAGAAEVRVVDAQTHLPVEGAITFVQGKSGNSDAAGLVDIPAAAADARAMVSVRAPGYARAELVLGGPQPAATIVLKQIKPRAVYLSVQGVSNRFLRDAAVALQRETAINALVIAGLRKTHAIAICASVWPRSRAMLSSARTLARLGSLNMLLLKKRFCAARDESGTPLRYLDVSSPCASGEKAMHPIPSCSNTSNSPFSIQRLSSE